MKKITLLLILVLSMVLNSCENYPYYVPDNFPTQQIHSYLPYKEGDTLLYTNQQVDTMRLVVKKHDQVYLRGQRNNANNVKENAAVITKLQNNQLNLTVSCACYERQRFEAKLTHQPLGENVQLLGIYVYEQEEMSDLIFNQFVNEINLSEDQATIKRNRGLIYFTDLQNVKWKYIGKRSKKK